MPSMFANLSGEPEIRNLYSGKKTLITGGRGYIGSCLAEALSEVALRVYALDRSSSKWTPSKADNFSVITADVCRVESYESLLASVDVVFHLAALEYSRTDFDLLKDYLANAKPMADMLDACARQNARPTIVFSSSANIFGGQRSLPINENNRDNPPSLWSAHKLLAENYLSVYSAQHGFRGMALRLPNVFGPSARSSTFNRSSVNSMILDALSKGVITLYGNSDCVRDFLSTEDCVRAFLLAGAKPAAGEVYVLGTGARHTYGFIAGVVCEAVRKNTGRDVTISHKTDAYNEPLDQRDFLADTTRFSAHTGWTAQQDIVSGIHETVRFAIDEGERLWESD